MSSKRYPAILISHVTGLYDALLGKLSTSLLKTSLTDNSDSFIASQKAVKTAVDAKQTTFAMNPTLISDSNLALSYFGNYRAVTREIDTDVTMTLNDDMKTGETFLYCRKNTHATLTRNVAVPLPRGGSSVFATVAGEYNDIYIRWDGKNAIWRFASSGSYAKVTS